MNIDWIAGFVDGEGSFNIGLAARHHREKWNIRFDCRLVVAIKHGADTILPAIKDFFGCGRLYTHGHPGHFKWQTTRLSEAIYVTEQLLPHLILKHDIATQFLEACKLLPTTRKGVNLHGGERVLTYDVAKRVTEIALLLNPGGRSYRYRNPNVVEEWNQRLNEVYAN